MAKKKEQPEKKNAGKKNPNRSDNKGTSSKSANPPKRDSKSTSKTPAAKKSSGTSSIDKKRANSNPVKKKTDSTNPKNKTANGKKEVEESKGAVDYSKPEIAKPIVKAFPRDSKPVKKNYGKMSENVKKSLKEKRKNTVKSGLEVVFLGGVGEIGKNMTALICDDEILIIDAGITFPDETTPGVDAIIPDFTYLKEREEDIVGIVVTHGHEDHIGALPYFLKDFSVPVYASDVTLALLSAKLEDRNIVPETHTVSDGDQVKIGNFTVDFFHVCHSVSGAFAISIDTKYGTVFHTGDFKIDFTPVDHQYTDLQRLGELGNKGVTLMLGESTNVEREGYTASEIAVGETLDRIFAVNEGRRIIIATFASNINRLQQIIDVATKYGRHIAFAGRSMLKSWEIGKKLEILKTLPDDVVELDRAVKMPDNKVCIVVTGSQGEPMSALTRMATGEYNKVSVGSNDTIVMSASPIPGNERSVYNVINNLYKLGAKVCYHTLRDIHVSGHAHREELKLMMSVIKPEYFMPVHGEYRHQVKHKELAVSLGVKEENILIPEVGWRVAVTKDGLKRRPDVPSGNSYVEGDEVGDNMENVISDRRMLSAEGLIILLLCFDEKGKLAAPPDVLTRGISAPESFIEEVKEEIINTFDNKKYYPEIRGALKVKIARSVRALTRKELKNAPMVIPIFVEK
ncbi:MAG: RNase J family beta-CASP ribonuclease [Clostridia bacterium]|nr:RNase J family beta-CASP ribonuclease [Clostridia bacterium]